MVIPVSIGEKKVLATFGRKITHRVVRQNFRYPSHKKNDEARIISFDWIEADTHPIIVLPITRAGEVVFLKQFRPPVNQVIWEIPGGNQKPGQTQEQAVAGELRDESGYTFDQLVWLNKGQFFEPASSSVEYDAALALGCHQVDEPNPHEGESIEVELIPLRELIEEYIFSGVVKDDKTQAVLFLALSHLGIRLEYPEWLTKR